MDKGQVEWEKDAIIELSNKIEECREVTKKANEKAESTERFMKTLAESELKMFSNHYKMSLDLHGLKKLCDSLADALDTEKQCCEECSGVGIVYDVYDNEHTCPSCQDKRALLKEYDQFKKEQNDNQN